MKRAYFVRPTRMRNLVERMRASYNVVGGYRWSLPKVRCPLCGAWGSSLGYPSVDPATLPSKVRACLWDHNSGDPMPEISLQSFGEIRSTLAPLLGAGRPVLPGIDFGPIRAHAAGRVPDMAWWSSGTLLVRESVYSELHAAGFNFVGVPAEIRFRRAGEEALLELEIRPTVGLALWPGETFCAECGKPKLSIERLPVLGRVDLLKEPAIEASTFDDAIPLQRMLWYSNKIVANEAFATFVRERGYSDIDFIPAEMV